MKPGAELPGVAASGPGMQVCSSRKSHETKSARLVGHSIARRTALQQGTGVHEKYLTENKGRELCEQTRTKDLLLVDRVLGVGAVRHGLALEAFKGLMEDLRPVGRPRREGGEVVIGPPVALLLPPPGGKLGQVEDGRVGVLELCHGG